MEFLYGMIAGALLVWLGPKGYRYVRRTLEKRKTEKLRRVP